MNRYQPSTIWGVATFRLWNVASRSMVSCAASYAAMTTQLMSSGRKILGEVADKNKVIQQATTNKEAALQAATLNSHVVKILNEEPSVPMPVTLQEMPRAIEPPVRSAVSESNGAQLNLDATKEFSPQSFGQGKGGKKRKNRPEARDNGVPNSTK